MRECLKNVPAPWGVILFVLLLFPAIASARVVDTSSQAPLTPFSTHQPNTSTFPWIKILQSSEPFQIILIDKASQTLEVLEQNGGSLRVIASYMCATGSQAGQKVQSGDSKTPEGIYFIRQSYADNKITIFGKRAFHLDYPNIFDKRENRNGDGIYIHGTNRKLIPQSTNGCITMRNKDLDLISQYLIENKTPVFIVEDKKKLSRVPIDLAGLKKDELISQIMPEEISQEDIQMKNLFVLSDGVQNIVAGMFLCDSSDYPYTTTFFRGYMDKDIRGKWLLDQMEYRGPHVTIAPVGRKIQVATAGVIQSFRSPQEYRQPSPAPADMKESEKVSIDQMDYLDSKVKVEPAVRKIQVATARQRQLPKPSSENPKTLPAISDITRNDEIKLFIERWRQAWTGKKLDEYIGCYAENFRQDNKDLRAWRKHKENLNRKYRQINVTIDNIKIDAKKNSAKVVFHQVYKSDKFYANGNKLLVLTYANGKGWQILRESWLK